MPKVLCLILFDFSFSTESAFCEEILFALQLLLGKKDFIPQCDFLLLLHHHSSIFIFPWSCDSNMGGVLYPSSHYPSQFNWNPKVWHFSYVISFALENIICILIKSFYFHIFYFSSFWQVFTSNYHLDILRKRHVLASMQSCLHWSVWCRESKWMGCHRESRECIKDYTNFNSC